MMAEPPFEQVTSASLDRRSAGRVTPRGHSVFLPTYVRYTAKRVSNLLKRPTSHPQPTYQLSVSVLSSFQFYVLSLW
jgi:hypothetical protein